MLPVMVSSDGVLSINGKRLLPLVRLLCGQRHFFVP